MRSERVVVAMLAILAVACQPRGEESTPAPIEAAQAASVGTQRQYVVRQKLTLTNNGPGQPEKQSLWVALVRDFPPYQQVQSLTVRPDTYVQVTDEYGNRYAEFDFAGQEPGSAIVVEIEAQVIVHEVSYDLSDCTGDVPDEFVGPELYVESANPQIVELSERLASPDKTACQNVRAFYEYVGNELTYTFNGQNWGAQAALGPMGSDCTEYTSLLMALSRAQGIPARYFEGLRYLEEEAGAEERVEHAWADVYLPSVGWVAMDPTLGRSSLTRETYFAHYTPDRIIITMGRNPSTLRGGSYWTHLYWPGDATGISVQSAEWEIELVGG